MELKSVEDRGDSRYRLTIDDIVFDVVYTLNGVIEGISGSSEFFTKLDSEDLAEAPKSSGRLRTRPTALAIGGASTSAARLRSFNGTL